MITLIVALVWILLNKMTMALRVSEATQVPWNSGLLSFLMCVDCVFTLIFVAATLVGRADTGRWWWKGGRK